MLNIDFGVPLNIAQVRKVCNAEKTRLSYFTSLCSYAGVRGMLWFLAVLSAIIAAILVVAYMLRGSPDSGKLFLLLSRILALLAVPGAVLYLPVIIKNTVQGVKFVFGAAIAGPLVMAFIGAISSVFPGLAWQGTELGFGLPQCAVLEFSLGLGSAVFYLGYCRIVYGRRGMS